MDTPARNRGSWLCPTDDDLGRALDMSPRIRRARGLGSIAGGVALLVVAPLLGWYVLGFFLLSAVNLQTLDWRVRRARRPELVIACSLLWTTIVIAAAVATTGGPVSPLLPWMSIPGALGAGRFRPRVTLVGAIVTVLIMLDATLAVDPARTLAHPALLLTSIALLVTVLATVSALTSAEIEHRTVATTDPLTGLLNRAALTPRFAELAHLAQGSRSCVAMIICDLDHFKRVNDTYGHERGDRVLCDAAGAIRAALRSFELVYRFGGEEFLIVLPDATIADGAEAAERVRQAVQDCRPGGLEITLSAGVAAACGHDVEFTSLLRAADRALYDAKRAGRNRYACADSVPIAAAALRAEAG